MGFDIQRFPNGIDEELICSICGAVLQDSLQAPTCEHVSCQVCIQECLSRAQTCPIDRTPIESDQLKPVPSILKNLLSRLNIACENQGCTTIVKLDALTNHLAECEYNPKKLTLCQIGCGMIISKDDLTSHNCIQSLQTELDNVKNDMEFYKNDMEFYKNDVRILQEFIHVIRLNNPTISCFFECVETMNYYVMVDFQTKDQKRRFAHKKFDELATDGHINWSNSRSIINKICPETSKTTINKLLNDADHDYLDEISKEAFISIIEIVLEEKSDDDNNDDNLDECEVNEKALDFLEKIKEMIRDNKTIDNTVIGKILEDMKIPLDEQ